MSTQGLGRFVAAQDAVYESVVAELAAGKKSSHWMWFIFPQLKELGRSATARHFGISGLDEAAAYWQHPVLGARLKRCTQLVLVVPDRTIQEVFGSPDDVKLGSCMTLFEAVAPEESSVGLMLARYFRGERDDVTLKLLT